MARIQAGKQWQPDGVVVQNAPEPKEAPRRSAPTGLILGLFLSLPLVALFIAPDVAAQVLTAVIADPSLDTAQAALLGN